MSVRDDVLRTVGRYEILREIGRGGAAVVHLARQTDLDRYVALKELAAFHAADADFVERFVRESRLGGSLSHPNVVTVHEYFEHDGTAFIAMEYLERGSLRPLVGSLRLAQVGGVLEGVLAGLAHAERRGIVHRDLKPENVMVTAEGGVKIADFGIAKALDSPSLRSLTGAGVAVGTPAYMAPELVTDGEVGSWTDLYAVGVMAYELLAGRLPFHETEHALALMLLHAKEPVPPLRSVRPELDSRLGAWVDRLLAKDPQGRPRGAGAAAEELDEILISTLGPRWRRQARIEDTEPYQALDGDGPTPVLRAGPTPVLRRGPRPRVGRSWLLAALAAAAVVAVVAAVVVTRPEQPAAVPQPRPPVADLIPRASQRLQLAVAGSGAVIADPTGRVVRLGPNASRVDRTMSDPARPRSLVRTGGVLLVADDESLTALDPISLAPRAAKKVAGASMLASGGGTVAVSLASDVAPERVCLVGTELRLYACATLPFTPSGLGVAPSGRLYIADGGTGTVRTYRVTARKLVPAGRVQVGVRPHGRLVVHRGLLYIPVERGVAIVDLGAQVVLRSVKLPVTPSDVWIAPATGRLFAALPGVDRVAVLDTDAPAVPPRLVAASGDPVAVGGGTSAAAAVWVVGIDGTVTQLDARTGRRLGAKRITGLGLARPAPLRLGRLTTARDGSAVTIGLAFTGGALGETSLIMRDATLADGKAAFEVWQGGVRTLVRTRSVERLTVRVTPAAGRLRVSLSAPQGRYERLRIEVDEPRTIVLSMRRVTPRATPRSGTSGGTTPAPPPPPPPPSPPPSPGGGYDIG